MTKANYTYPASFRPVGNDCLYTVNPGIPLPLARDELSSILKSVNFILINQYTDDTLIKGVWGLVNYALNIVEDMRGGVIELHQLDAIGTALTDSSIALEPRWNEPTLCGVLLLLSIAIGLTRSFAESCKGGKS